MTKGDVSVFDRLPEDILKIINRKVKDDWIVYRKMEKRKNREIDLLRKHKIKILFKWVYILQRFQSQNWQEIEDALDMVEDDEQLFQKLDYRCEFLKRLLG